MSQVVPSDIQINDDIVRAVLLEQFDVQVNSCRILGEGWDNLVYLINDTLVFRFPRRAQSVELLEREISILTKLAVHVTLQIPHPTYIGQASAHFARPFYGHPFLLGTSGCRVQLSPDEFAAAAKTLAQFLRGLHGLDVSKLDFEPKDLTPAFDRADWPKMKQVFLKRLGEVERNYALDAYQEKISMIMAKAEGYQANLVKPCLIHGDLYHRHLLFDHQNRLTSIIDWGDAGIGDYVADLGVVFQFFPKACHDEFWSTYGDVPTRIKEYARFLGLYSAIALLWYGHDRCDHDLVRTSLWTIETI